MTIRTDMLRTVSRAREILGDSAGAVADFVRARINPDGGFKGRGTQSDLYYTVFGLELLSALQAEMPGEHTCNYLRNFDPKRLDLVHLASFVRCHVNLAEFIGSEFINDIKDEVVRQMKKYRSGDGGFSTTADAKCGNIYGCFLALGSYQDLELPLDRPEAIVNCIESSRKQNGGYSNEKKLPAGTTPATAAAVVSLKNLGCGPSQSSLDWLLSRANPKGGFAAIPNDSSANFPDLLSTATALHALVLSGSAIDNIKEKCLDYLDSLWSSEGGFAGNWFDPVPDCEYTYYGLLSLGHLGV